MKRVATVLAVASVLTLIQVRSGLSQSSDFVAGSRDLFVLDLASVQTGELPQVCGPKRPPPCLEMIRGNLTTVDKDGERMLRASDAVQIWLRLPEVLPSDFTIELDLIPKPLGIGGDDFGMEGSREQNRGPASTMLDWQTQHISVYGGGEPFQRDPPEDIKLATSATLTELRISFDKGTFKFYTNGQRLVNLPGRAFVRTRGIRLEFVGQDDDKQAVYVSKLRLATNSPKPQ